MRERELAVRSQFDDLSVCTRVMVRMTFYAVMMMMVDQRVHSQGVRYAIFSVGQVVSLLPPVGRPQIVKREPPDYNVHVWCWKGR